VRQKATSGFATTILPMVARGTGKPWFPIGTRSTVYGKEHLGFTDSLAPLRFFG
jgi:hypothetical protein